jgi:hypothetical protein
MIAIGDLTEQKQVFDLAAVTDFKARKASARGESLLHFAKQTIQAVKVMLRKMLRSPFQNAPPERFSTAFDSPH